MENKLRFTIKYGGNTFVLQDSPEGWDEELTQFERGSMHGITRKGSMNLRFVGDGALVIRNAYYSGGVNATITIDIERLNLQTMAYEYLMQDADIDLSGFNDQPYFVEVPIIDGGLQQLFDNDVNTKFEIPLPATTIIKYDGVRIYSGETLWQKTNVNQTNIDGVTDGQQGVIPIIISTNTDNTGTPSGYAVNTIPDLQYPPLHCYTANRRGKITTDIYIPNITFTLEASFASLISGWGETIYLRWRHTDGLGVTKELKTISSTTVALNYASGNYFYEAAPVALFPNLEYDFNMEQGDLLYLEFYRTGHQSEPVNYSTKFQFVSLSLQIDTATTLPIVNIQAIKAIDLIQALLNKIETGNNVVSVWLNALPDDEQILFTSGDAVRSITDPVIKVSMQDVFNALDAAYMIGMGINGTELIVEQRGEYYRDLQLFDIGEVRELNVKPIDEQYKTIKVGWPNQEYNELNGRDEFNSIQTWRLPLRRNDAELNLVPSVRADMYGIDYLRVTYNGNSSTDTQSDNSVFMLDCQFDETQSGTDYYILSRDKFSNISGLTNEDTAYNLLYSPKRCLLRWGSYISGLMHNATGLITQTSAEKNVDLSSLLDTESVNVLESAYINPTTLASPYFLPYVFTFEVAERVGLFNFLVNNPFGYVAFQWQGNTYYGFIQSASIRDARLGILSYTLLASPNNDLTTLIRR